MLKSNFQQNKKATNMQHGGGLQMGQPPMPKIGQPQFPRGNVYSEPLLKGRGMQFPNVQQVTGMRNASASAESFAKLLETFRTRMIRMRDAGNRNANSIRRY